jgi:hypothetical protein
VWLLRFVLKVNWFVRSGSRMNLTVRVKKWGSQGRSDGGGAIELGALTGDRGLSDRVANQFGMVTEGPHFRRSLRA